MTEHAGPLSLRFEDLSPGVHDIVRHLCEGECHTYGSVLQWCETRGDCVYAVTCPTCSSQFVVEEDELAELERWTESNGHALVCGVRLQ